jgi:hypothetical protein
MRNMRENDVKNEKEKTWKLCHIWNTTPAMLPDAQATLPQDFAQCWSSQPLLCPKEKRSETAWPQAYPKDHFGKLACLPMEEQLMQMMSTYTYPKQLCWRAYCNSVLQLFRSMGTSIFNIWPLPTWKGSWQSTNSSDSLAWLVLWTAWTGLGRTVQPLERVNTKESRSFVLSFHW